MVKIHTDENLADALTKRFNRAKINGRCIEVRYSSLQRHLRLPCALSRSCSTVAYIEYNHKCCSCGGHCSCNPCTCSKIQANKICKAHCSCGTACKCPT
ncbi:hypothetical protein CICLE_v10030183mg [Citrus x clementina]|uniref:Uncharacterized protein n=1 Tax=Citrus clementina TaxID=85681 RepID=V4U8V5_CITCL|nr:hypothetical protein CICLE_v10030183mg [Citrus x clementina]